MPEVALPAFVSLDGDWSETCARLYIHFEGVFKQNPRRRINNKPLVFDSRILDGEYEESFWHIITTGKGDDRLLDPERARRVCWIEHVLNRTAPGLTCWSFQEGDGASKLYYWLEAEKYVLILVEKPRVVALVTAFYVSSSWLETDLRKRREKGTAL